MNNANQINKKLDYADTSKNMIRDVLKSKNADITDETVFRDYANLIETMSIFNDYDEAIKLLNNLLGIDEELEAEAGSAYNILTEINKSKYTEEFTKAGGTREDLTNILTEIKG